MSKKNPFDTVLTFAEEIKKAVKHWCDIREHGCSDPFWPDGTNLNLVRNHIIYYKKQISEICLTCGVIAPEEFYIETPPVVPEDLFTGKVGDERYKKMSSFPFHTLLIPDETTPKYRPQHTEQISLFDML